MNLFPAHELRFMRGFLAKPLQIASPFPSGRKLAAEIAKQVDPGIGGQVLELGPGTGAVTRAILARGVAAPDLITIESDAGFVALLRESFPGITVVEGNAFEFSGLLRGEGYSEPLGSIVSGLPVLSQTVETRVRLLRDAMKSLRPGALFIQFSYGMRPPIPVVDEIRVVRAAVVYQNVPPMHIWVYRAPA